MPKIIDSEYLLNEQYKTTANLDARINLHTLFSTNQYGWFRWVFDHYAFPENARILELGCGPGDLWRENLGRIPADWRITLSDFSPGMLAKAQAQLAEHPFTFEIIGAQSIPYPEDHFDGVIANHCIYHFPDRRKALSEIRRVLKPGQRFFATTGGDTHLQGLPELIAKFDPNLEEAFPKKSISFTLESGTDQLREFFQYVEMERYPDEFLITAAGPLVDYVLSSIRNPLDKNRRAEFLTFVEAELTASNGVIHIHKDAGLFMAQ